MCKTLTLLTRQLIFLTFFLTICLTSCYLIASKQTIETKYQQQINKCNILTKLFLIKPGFTDSNRDSEGKLYYCPFCATLEGIIKYYPQLEKLIEINYVDFKRPRPAIIELIGEENQSCPVLIIDNKQDNNVNTSYFTSYGDKLFVDSTDLISRYLTEKFGIGILH